MGSPQTMPDCVAWDTPLPLLFFPYYGVQGILHEFYQVAFHKKLYNSLEGLQTDLDEWLDHYNLGAHASRQNVLR